MNAHYDFLPEGYKDSSSTGQYIRPNNIPEGGELKVRLLSYPIVYWQDWTQSKQPLRFPYNKKPLASIDPDSPVQECWSFVVWNYEASKSQIFTVSQKTVRLPIREILSDPSWGGLWNFDLRIKKEKSGGKTSYSVLPCMTKKLPLSVERDLIDNPVCLQALLENENPFCYVGTPTKLYFTEADAEWDVKEEKEGAFRGDREDISAKGNSKKGNSTLGTSTTVSSTPVPPAPPVHSTNNPNSDLLSRLNSCPAKFRDSVLGALAQSAKADGSRYAPDLSDLTPALADRIESAVDRELSKEKIAL